MNSIKKYLSALICILTIASGVFLHIGAVCAELPGEASIECTNGKICVSKYRISYTL